MKGFPLLCQEPAGSAGKWENPGEIGQTWADTGQILALMCPVAGHFCPLPHGIGEGSIENVWRQAPRSPKKKKKMKCPTKNSSSVDQNVQQNAKSFQEAWANRHLCIVIKYHV